MPNVFAPCELPWCIGSWGLQLIHSDTDVTPECAVQFAGLLLEPSAHYREVWVRVEFTLAAFVMAKPHRDDEELSDVTGYDIVARRELSTERHDRDQAEWQGTGVCPDPGLHFSTDSDWLDAIREPWAARQRTSKTPADAVHFLLDGRDGYLEIAAASFTWQVWNPGYPRLSEVDAAPILSGTWAR